MIKPITILRQGFPGSLRFRLTSAVILTVLVVSGVGMIVDYQRSYGIQIDQLFSSLQQHAKILSIARDRFNNPDKFALYVDDFCAQMNVNISPGHHILVLDKKGDVLIRTRHHSGIEVEQALLKADPQKKIITTGSHRLAQVRLKDKNDTIIVLAQYLDHLEDILRSRLIRRGLNTALIAFAIILLLYLVLFFWVIKPVAALALAAKSWGARDFQARSMATGPNDFRFLAHELNSMAKELEKYETRRMADLERARVIQTGLLPSPLPSVEGLKIAVEYHPAQHVAGDLYDIFELPDWKTAIAIIDVSGHGICAALLTGIVKMSLRCHLSDKMDLVEALQLVNRDLLLCVSEGQFVTACVGIWNNSDRSWTYATGGHPGGILLSSGQTTQLDSTGMLLGIVPDGQWEKKTILLDPGDRLFLYTDGIIEAGIPSCELTNVGLEKLLRQGRDQNLAEQITSVQEEVFARNSHIHRDDTTLVGLEVSI